MSVINSTLSQWKYTRTASKSDVEVHLLVTGIIELIGYIVGGNFLC